MSNRRHAGRFGEDPVVKDDSPVSRGNPATIANDDGQSKHMDAKSKDTLLISEAIEAVGAHRVFSSQNTKNKGGNKAKGLQMAAAVVDGTGARHGSKEEKKNDDDKAKNKLSLASASEMIPSPVGVVAGTFQNNNDDKAKNKLSLASASETISASPVGVAAGTFRNNRQDASSDDDGILSDDDDDEERPGAYRISGVNGGDEDMYGDSDRPRNDGDDDVLLDADLVDPDAERQEALKEILRTSVEAQALSVDELRKRRRRWYFGGCCMLVLVAVGASLGGYYGSRSDPLELPPTVAPTVSMAPSVSPSSVPSSTPTLFHELCEKARTIESLPYFHSGTTGQTSELGDASPALSCPLISSFDRGVWFAVNGTGGCMSAVATGRNLDTKIAIYTGSCTAMLLCVTNKEEGQAEWTSQANQRYYILLVGQNSAAGDYSLSVSDIGTICNNVCEEPVHVNYLPYFFEGTTERAPFIEEPTAMTCLLVSRFHHVRFFPSIKSLAKLSFFTNFTGFGRSSNGRNLVFHLVARNLVYLHHYIGK